MCVCVCVVRRDVVCVCVEERDVVCVRVCGEKRCGVYEPGVKKNPLCSVRQTEGRGSTRRTGQNSSLGDLAYALH